MKRRELLQWCLGVVVGLLALEMGRLLVLASCEADNRFVFYGRTYVCYRLSEP